MTTRAFLGIGLLSVVFTVSMSAQDSSAPGLSSDQPGAMTTGSITGSLRTVDDRPVPNAQVQARDLNTGRALSTTYTQANGMFELYNIQMGAYELVATLGTEETHERVQVTQINASVSLRIHARGLAADGSPTVSVSKFKIPEKARKEYEKGAEAFAKNKLDEAHKHIDKALAIYPNYAEALVIRGLLSTNGNDAQAGEADLQAAITADPNYGMAYIAMGAILNQGHRYEEAKRVLQRGVSLSPNSWQGYFETGKAAMGLSDYEAALKNVERAHSLVKDDYAPIHFLKANALLGLKQYDKAVAELEQFLSRDPGNPNAQYARNTLDKARTFLATNNNGSK